MTNSSFTTDERSKCIGVYEWWSVIKKKKLVKQILDKPFTASTFSFELNSIIHLIFIHLFDLYSNNLSYVLSNGKSDFIFFGSGLCASLS